MILPYQIAYKPHDRKDAFDIFWLWLMTSLHAHISDTGKPGANKQVAQGLGTLGTENSQNGYQNRVQI